ncbi:MAG TPA: hypothetical protein DDZ83_03875, partial [Nitrospinae bacterium]|nr:hypothetical protein [Nitrospinota bacterium]
MTLGATRGEGARVYFRPKNFLKKGAPRSADAGTTDAVVRAKTEMGSRANVTSKSKGIGPVRIGNAGSRP